MPITFPLIYVSLDMKDIPPVSHPQLTLLVPGMALIIPLLIYLQAMAIVLPLMLR